MAQQDLMEFQMYRRLSALCALSTLLLVGACSSCDDSAGVVGGGDAELVDGSGGPVDASDGGADGKVLTDGESADSETDENATDAADVGCGSGVSCGGTCCDEGKVCVEEVCRDPCEGTRCGEMSEQCCTGEEVCIFDGCQTPGAECQNSFECPDDEYCEETLGSCLPRSARDEECTYRPPTGEFTPERKGSYQGVDHDGSSYDKVMATPTVADIDDDGVPEIVSLLYRGGLSGALIAVVDSQKMSTIAYGAVEEIQPNSAGIAVGQLDPSTPELEVVAPHVGGGLIGLKYDASAGELTEWWTTEQGGLGNISTESAPSIADVEGDGDPEVVFGFSIVEADGSVWNGRNGGPAGGQRSGSALTTAVDLDGTQGRNGNADLEIVAGNRAMKLDGSMLWDRSGEVSDGFPAVGDFGNDGTPEVVVVTEGEVYILDGQTGATVFGPKAIPGGGEGGPPTIADFDGDDVVEFAAAGRGQYTVYDRDCQGEDPAADRCPSGRSDGILWTKQVQDTSSSRTGSSVFDFEGDGQAEVVYNDECFLRVFNGRTGEVLFERANTSRTGSEYPIIADVDRDFNAEIVVASNNDQLQRDDCRENFEDYPQQGTKGIFVYGDADDRWVPTRTIWNQHAYHITNVREDGAIPTNEPVHYDSSITNSFRLNAQPDGLFNAPDLVVEDVAVTEGACTPEPSVEVAVTVANDGALGVGPGVVVGVEARVDGSMVDIGGVQTTRRLLPGQSETVSTSWELPEAARQGTFTVETTADADDGLNECRNDNNSAEREIDGTSLEFDSLTVAAFSVDAAGCGIADDRVDFEITVDNQGSSQIPAGVPVVIEGTNAGNTRELTTVQTSAPLDPGASEKLTGTWQTPQSLFGQTYDATASIDPDESVIEACGDQASEPVEVDCEQGG
jgi:hypothetical protein